MTPRAPLLVGFGITNQAVARALTRRGADVVVVDDHPSPALTEAARAVGATLLEAPSGGAWTALLTDRDALIPTPGLPEAHPVFAAAEALDVAVRSEFDLAMAWDNRPVVAITGTDGKTTVVTLVTAMFEASGRRAVAAGNTEVPLVAAIDDPTTEIFIVEASSFRLAHTARFRPLVATWLNWAPDHLDVHRSLESYQRAKARIWADLDEHHGVAVANADDPVVSAHRNPRVRTVTFGLDGPGHADYTVTHTDLVLPDGTVVVPRSELSRDLPHDVANALAAAATALEGGATLDGVRSALRSFTGLPHRVQFVAEHDGVRWYDDSKATAPHATLAAIAGFDTVVLVAGGRNKGLDLGELAAGVPHLRAVVAIGEASDDLVAVFTGRVPVVRADSMDAAVAAAAAQARPGDAVVLSPGCASFDWYRSYAERGNDFVRAVHALLDTPTPEVRP